MLINKKSTHYLADTLREIERLANTYYTDLISYKDYTIKDFFDFCAKTINYKKDPPDTELVMRPRITIKRGCGDCDDKATLFLAWCKLKGIECGYSIVSQKADKDYHHIFCYLIYDGDNHLDADCTYDYNRLGERKDWAKRRDFDFYRG